MDDDNDDNDYDVQQSKDDIGDDDDYVSDAE